MSRRSRRFFTASNPPALRVRRAACRALLVVDNRPLQSSAWADLRIARKKLEKASRDLHRHEQIDGPAFRAWLGTTFPELVTAVRDLILQVATKERLVRSVESEAWISGRAPGAIWRAWQRAESAESPDASGASDDDSPSASGNRAAHDNRGAPADDSPFDDDRDPGQRESGRADFDADFDRFCAAQGLDPENPVAQAMRDVAASMSGFDLPRGYAEPAATDARDIYRRLVQHLHPDRGGEWTPARARLWHEVQEAWGARDGDLLARLEVEWETATDALGPTSPVGRLRAALVEIHSARRDAERKVRHYRKTPEWRFSLQPPDARVCEQLRRDLNLQREHLQTDLDELEGIIASWERTRKRPRPRRRARQRDHAREAPRSAQPEFAFAFDYGPG